MRAAADQHDRRTFARAETEQADDAFDRRLAAVEMHFDVRIVPARRFARTRGRPRMQAAGLREHELAPHFVHRGCARLRGLRGGLALAAQREQRRLAGRRETARALDHVERIGIRDRDHRYQRMRGARDCVLIELDQQVARFDARAGFDARGEALPVQLDGVDADVQQHFRAVRRRDRHRVTRAREMRHDARARCDQLAGKRIDADAVAEHPAGEHRIGHVGQCDDRPRQRGEQDDLIVGGTLQLGLLGASHRLSRLSVRFGDFVQVARRVGIAAARDGKLGRHHVERKNGGDRVERRMGGRCER
ncbi:hypothetical protein FEP76_01171 [Burkholderia multivorans]|nr:hypothetical protein [Burkholderia multivorans]